MQELYRFDNIVAYRFGCLCNNHEHVLDVEIDTDEDRIVLVNFKEHFCSKTRNLLWRVNAAVHVLFGGDMCLREVELDASEADELAKILNKINVDRMGVLPESDETTGQPG